ncbi:uncharacterized protein F4812DRAFT_197056 [Daldinia caldariorum]|uniref:uncharacterized protein n=1 Tax=Daldinia caldariorum TaxID=326644 RepID=UPI0020072F11|nr:uncharacterized protein F4812DRAFT_197056 [Daldinia caldariorum]KAI1471872.1 hypothetical protein F4812DRAFT_197056 [Daldinia caldariorum]
MEYNVNPLDFHRSPTGMNDSTTSNPHPEHVTQDLDIFDDLQLENIQPDSLHHLRWDMPVPEVIGVDGRVYSQPNASSDASAKSFDLDTEFYYRHGPLDDDLTPESLESQQAIHPSHDPIKRRVCNIEDEDSSRKSHLLQHSTRRCSQSKLPSPLSSGDDCFTAGGFQKVQKLEKNRVAASKCREKKKRETENLQTRAKTLTAERKALKFMADALREEVIELRTEILKHGMCDCQVIQKYITESARNIA